MKQIRILLWWTVILVSIVTAQNTVTIDKDQVDITALIGEGLQRTITASHVQITKGSLFYDNKIEFKRGGWLAIKEGEKTFLYGNIKEGGVIGLNSKGEINSAEFTVGEKEETYIFRNDRIVVPRDSQVFFSGSRLLLMVPAESVIREFPQLENESEKGNSIEVMGNNVHFPGGFILNSGVLSSRDGVLFVKEDNEAVINGIEMKNWRIAETLLTDRNKEKIIIFRDGKIHPESENTYASLDPVKGKVILVRPRKREDNNPPEFVFLKDNPFLKIDERDHIVFSPLKGMVSITNRDKEGLIPEVRINGAWILENGGYEVKLWGEVDLRKRTEETFKEKFLLGTSSPMVITWVTEDGQDGLAGEQLVVGNYNEIAAIPKESVQGLFQRKGEYGKVTGVIDTSLRFNYKLDKEEFKRKTGIPLEGDIKPDDIKRLYDFYISSPSLEKKRIKKVISQPFAARSHTGNAAYDVRSNTLYIVPEMLEYPIFRHELAHAAHDYLRETGSDFEVNWKAVQGDDGYKKRARIIPGFGASWKGGGKEPRYGFVNPYGSVDIWEDVATYVEGITTEDGINVLKDVTNRQNKKYEIRYGVKMYLLRKYDLISPVEWWDVKEKLNLLDEKTYEKVLEYL